MSRVGFEPYWLANVRPDLEALRGEPIGEHAVPIHARAIDVVPCGAVAPSRIGALLDAMFGRPCAFGGAPIAGRAARVCRA